MQLSSLFKFKRKKIDLPSLVENIFEDVESNLFSELNKETYYWLKSNSIKRYECFIFSKFLIDYSFSISHKDLDKNIINLFSKISEDVFIELHNKKYSEVLVYKDMKNTIDEKYSSFYSLRKENKPPVCWHLIYSLLINRRNITEIKSDIRGLEKAVQLLSSKSGADDLVSRFKDIVNIDLKKIESFDLAEILFRQNIRSIKKELLSIDIPRQLSSKK